MIKAKTKKLDIVVVGDDTKSDKSKLRKTPGVLFSMDEMQLTLKENSGWIGQVMVPDMAVNVEKKQADNIAEIDDQVEFMFSIDIDCNDCAAVVMVGWTPSTSWASRFRKEEMLKPVTKMGYQLVSM